MTIALGDWPQLMPLVEQALSMPTSERGAWLAGIQLMPSIRVALLELLEDRQAIESGNFLGAMPRLDSPTPMRAGRLAAGHMIGAWRLLHEIGEGGMSTVWLAERADGQINRQVALKLPHAGPGQHLLAMRLLRERNILAALQHPHIGRLYDVGVTDAGMPYLVMEFVAGHDILAHADAHGLVIARRIGLFQQVLSAVQYAHSQLILHRDLKPANVLVDAAGDVKLLDFGIAKALAANGSAREATELTSAAGRMLTPAYASPEQLRGQALSTASDVYALGVVLHELLTGERPCGVTNTTSAAAVEQAILNVEPQPPSRGELSEAAALSRGVTVRSLRAQLAGDLDAIVLKSLAKSPGARYASPADLATDLARWQSGQPVSVRTPGVWYYGRKFVGRHRLGTAFGSLALVAVIAAAGLAVSRGLEASREAAKAIAARQFMQDLFHNSDPDLYAGHAPTGRELLAQGRAKLLKAAATDTSLPVDELLKSIAEAQFDQGDSDSADSTLVILLGRLSSSPDPTRRISAWLLRADIALDSRKIDHAKAALAQAESEARLNGTDAPTQRKTVNMEGRVALHDNRPTDARAALQRYLRLSAASPDEPPDNVVEAQLALAKIESMDGHHDLAKALLAAAAAQAASRPELDTVRFGEVALYRANIDVESGLYASVAAWLPGTLAECNRALGVQSADCHNLAAQLVRVLLKRGEATQALDAATVLQAQMDDSRNPSRQANAAILLARSDAWAGGDARLQTYLERLATLGASADVRPPQRLLILNTLAEIGLLERRPVEAMAWIAKAHELSIREHLASSREAAKTSSFEGAALQAQGKSDLALRAFGALCDQDKLASSPLPVLDRLLSLNCARSLADTGKMDAALALVSQALPVLRDGLGKNAPVMLRVEGLLQELRTPAVSPPNRKLELFS